MKYLFFLIFSFFIIKQSHASYFESCEVTAKVLNFLRKKQSYNLKINVLSYKIQKGSHGETHCKAKINKTLDINLKKIKSIPKAGKPIKLIYSYSDGLGPQGIVITERWAVK